MDPLDPLQIYSTGGGIKAVLQSWGGFLCTWNVLMLIYACRPLVCTQVWEARIHDQKVQGAAMGQLCKDLRYWRTLDRVYSSHMWGCLHFLNLGMTERKLAWLKSPAATTKLPRCADRWQLIASCIFASSDAILVLACSETYSNNGD